MNIYRYPTDKEVREIITRPTKDAADLTATVAAVLARIKNEGDAAVLNYELQFDKVNLMFERTDQITSIRFLSLRRKGGTLGVILVLLLIVAAIGGGAYWRINHSKSSKKVNLIFATAERGTFIHEVNGKGSAESAKNVDVASQVEGSATIIYLIPEGSDVKKGELLVELDSSDIDEKLDSQVVTTNSSRATLNS